MGLLTMFDAVTVDNIPVTARYVALYADGQFNNLAAGRAHCPHAEVLTITVIPANTGECCDCEVGDLTVAQAETWVVERLAAGVYRPCVYADADRWENQGLASALAGYGSRIRRWVAAYPGTGANVPVGYDAHQYATGELDTSVCLADFFDGPPSPPPVVKQASAEVQVSLPEGTTGTLRAMLTLRATGSGGAWTVHEMPGVVHWSGGGGGKWRVRGMDWNAPPLGN